MRLALLDEDQAARVAPDPGFRVHAALRVREDDRAFGNAMVRVRARTRIPYGHLGPHMPSHLVQAIRRTPCALRARVLPERPRQKQPLRVWNTSDREVPAAGGSRYGFTKKSTTSAFSIDGPAIATNALWAGCGR